MTYAAPGVMHGDSVPSYELDTLQSKVEEYNAMESTKWRCTTGAWAQYCGYHLSQESKLDILSQAKMYIL